MFTHQWRYEVVVSKADVNLLKHLESFSYINSNNSPKQPLYMSWTSIFKKRKTQKGGESLLECTKSKCVVVHVLNVYMTQNFFECLAFSRGI